MKYFNFLSIFFILSLFCTLFQSCSEESHVGIENSVENSIEQSKGFNANKGQFFSAVPAYAPSVTLTSANIEYDFGDKEVRLVSSALDVSFSALSKHWQKQLSTLLGRDNTKLDVYTYDDGSELLIVEYETQGEKKRDYFYSSISTRAQVNGAPRIIRVSCKGSCSNGVQNCSGKVDVSTGNVNCTCQSGDCYMEFATLN